MLLICHVHRQAAGAGHDDERQPKRANGKFPTVRQRASTDKVVARAKLGEYETAKARGEKYSDPFKEHRDRPLAEHVADWTAELSQIGRDDQYVAPCKARLERLMSECGWKVLGDIDADDFSKWRETADGRADHNREDKTSRTARSLSPRAKNHYLATLNTFCRWCIRRKRMAHNPADLLRKAKGDAGDGDRVVKVLPRIPTHRKYLDKAGIPWQDDAGRRADIHCLRHS